MSVDIGPRIGIDGEKEFRQELNNINQQLRTLGSEMKAVTSAFEDGDQSEAALAAQTDVLNRQIDAQRQKLTQLQKGLDASAQKYGENDTKTLRWQQAVNEATASLNKMESQLQSVQSQMSGSESAYDSLTRKISQQEAELSQLRTEHTNAVLSFGKTSNEAQELAQKIGALSSELKQNKTAMDQAEQATNGLKTALDGGIMESIGGLLSDAGLGGLSGILTKGLAVGTVVSGVQQLAGSITEIVDATEDYRRVMGTLEVSSQAAGYTTKQTTQIYEQLYSVLGDTQSAATATANLQAIGLAQEDLVVITDAAIGAWARYGDSIPIDGLAESINETIQAGTVTGTFADVLNWAGTSEDVFNAKLSAAKTTAERSNIVLQELSRQGLPDVAQAWRETNSDIVAANESQAAYEEAQARLGEQLAPFRDGLRDLATAGVNFLADAIYALTGGMGDLDDSMDSLSAGSRGGDFGGSRGGGFGSVAESAQESSNAISDLTANTEDQILAAQELAQVEGLLSTALQEENEQKTLSLGTTLDLIEAGYGAALSVDQETGAVTLNRDAYEAMAKAKIADQIASLETQRNSAKTLLAMKDEAIMATELGKSYYTAVGAKLALNGQIKSYDAQIAALNELKDSLENYQATGVSAARSSLTTAKTVKTQAENDLETYKALVDDLDHLREMDKVSDAEYYKKLGEYRDQYLTDETNLAEYRKVTEKIYGYDKDLAEKEAELWEDQTKALSDELQNRIDTVLNERQNLADTLSGYGDLFTITDDKFSLGSLQDQINGLKAYEEALSSLKERGVAEGLLDTIIAMDVDEATRYTQELLKLTDDQYAEYMGLWTQKQAEAQRIATEFYAGELDALNAEYVQKIPEMLSGLKDDLSVIGQVSAQGLADGFEQEADEIRNAFVNTIEQALIAAKEEMGINSPSTVWHDDVGAPMASGLVQGFNDELDAMADTMMQSIPVPTMDGIQTTAAGMVNGLAAISGNQRIVVEVPVIIDGKEFYRFTLDDLRAVQRANPEVVKT